MTRPTRAVGTRARVLAAGVCAATVLAAAPGIASAAQDIPYVEQGAPTPVGQYLTVTDPGPYDGKFVEFAVSGGDASDVLSLRDDVTPDVTEGAVSVVAGVVYVGNGTSAEQVGRVDLVTDGNAGRSLRVNFSSAFQNAGFESGDLDGWTPVNQQIDLGVTAIDGFVPVDRSTYPSNVPHQDDNVPSALGDLSTTVQSDVVSEGSHALRLVSSEMQTQAGCDVVHGPAVYSSPFAAKAGDSIYFDWRAYAGEDNYHVFGYIVDAQGHQIDVLDATGAGTTPWTTKQTEIPADGTYTFVFVSGTHDASCGRAAGASLVIDNVQVYGHKVGASVVQEVARHLLYSSTTDRPASTRTITMNAVTQGGGTATGDTVVTVEPVDDPPAITGFSAPTVLSNVEGPQAYATTTGTVEATDPDGDVLTYGIDGGVAEAATVDGQTYTHARTGTYGTLHVDATTGRYAFVPATAAVDARLTPDTESFPVTATASGVTVSAPYTVTVDLPPTPPGAPTALAATAGDRQVSLSWTAPAWLGGSAVSGYRIERSDDGGASWTVVTENSGGPATTATVPGLTGGATSTFRVSAVNATATGLPSAPVAATPYAPASAPTIRSVQGGAHRLTVAFTAPVDVRGSAVTTYEYSLDGGATWTPRTSGGTASPLVISGLDAKVAYAVQLRAVNAAGGGDASAPVTGQPVLAPVTAPGLTGEVRPEVPAGQSLLVVDGERRGVTVSTTAGAWDVTGDGFTARLRATEEDGTPLPVDDQGRLVVHSSGSVQVSGTGFRPGSTVDVWLFSTPYLLGEATVAADGTFSATFALPDGVPVGAHTVQMNGVSTDGAVRSLSTGVVVLADPVATPAAAGTPLATTGAQSGDLALLALALLGAGVLAVRVRRRLGLRAAAGV